MESQRAQGNRRRRLRRALQEDALLVFGGENIFYLSGFAGAMADALAVLVVSRRRSLLLVDFRYVEEALAEARGVSVKLWKSPLYEELAGNLGGGSVRAAAFEPDVVTMERFKQLRRALSPVKLVPRVGLVERLRTSKDPTEVERMRRAARLGDRAFEHILPFVEPGVRERDLALELEFFMRTRGAPKASFDIIVASGPNSSRPHARTSNRRLKKGEFVVFDLGAVRQFYRSDMSRTVVCGKATPEMRRMYGLVAQAQEEALSVVRAGMTGRQADEVARSVLREAGFGAHFGHGLGHGVGLKIHEAPRLSPESTGVLPVGAVVTIEPGVYVPGFGGVRIEDMVLLGAAGAERLTRSPKALLEL